MGCAPAGRFRFGGFELDPETCELWREGRPVPIQQQPARVLALLIDRPGALVTREEIRQYLWGASTFVEYDESLNYCIRQIRLALDDAARAPRFVETLPKRGYRFIAPVTRVDKDARAKAVAPRRLPRSVPGRLAAAAAIAAAMVTAGWGLRPGAGAPPARDAQNAHHETALAALRLAHDSVFGASSRESSHHRTARDLLTLAHALVF
jgi:DNA-binding winged helix-turn-helix (wHTH) protein